MNQKMKNFLPLLLVFIVLMAAAGGQAAELALPFGLQWGDSPSETEAKLKKACTEVYPTADPMFKNSIIYGGVVNSADVATTFFGVVGENGLYEIVGMTIVTGKYNNQEAAIELASYIAREMIKNGGKLTANDNCLYSILTSYIHANINVHPSSDDTNQRFHEKTWTVLIKYTPPNSFTKPNKNYSDEIKNALHDLADIRR